jgi:hypothetical protein
MALFSFELNQLFILHVPLLVMFHHGSQKESLSERQKWVGVGSQKDKARCWQGKLKVSEMATTARNCWIALRSFSTGGTEEQRMLMEESKADERQRLTPQGAQNSSDASQSCIGLI